MITEWQMYWLVMLDSIVRFFHVIAFIFGILFVVGLIAYISEKVIGVSEKDEKSTRAAKALKTPLIITMCLFFMSFLSTTFLPSTKQMAAIIIVPKIINNKKAQEIPDKLLNLTDEWIKELSPTKEKENDS